MSVNPEGIPQELRDLPRWMMWRGKKVPYQTNGLPASSTDPSTWAAFNAVLGAESRFDGIAFALGEPYFGIDLDNCFDAGGNPYQRAAKIVEDFASYTEVSPSGNGLHIIGRGRKPGPNCKKELLWIPGVAGRVEVYDQARYFCFTGNIVADAPTEIAERTEALAHLYRSLWPEVKQVARTTIRHDAGNNAARCHAYLIRCPDSISGQNGHDRFLHVACETFRFALTEEERWAELRWWSENKSGGEPWNEKEIAHKIESARTKTAHEVGVRLVEERPNGTLNGVHHNGTHGLSPHGKAKSIWVPKTKLGFAFLNDRLDEVRDGRFEMTPFSMWPTLSTITQALLPGTITLVCGSPGSGKSFWLLSAALGWLRQGVPFSMFELEEDRTYHLHRAAAMLTGKANLLDLAWVKANGPTIDEHRETIDALGSCIHDAPESHVSLTQLGDWYEEAAKTSRVVVIDPITAASAGDKRWLEDEKFIERAKRIARNSGSSLVLVTHPKTGQRKGAPGLDDLAGGAGYARFTQTVMVLADRDPTSPVRVIHGPGSCMEHANRLVHVRKARNGKGGGLTVAFQWDKNTLEFREVGIVARES